MSGVCGAMMRTTDHIASMNSPAFRTWVDDVSCVDPKRKPNWGHCENCGTGVGVIPFVGDFCLFCAAYHFGRYEKSMELASFVKLVLRVTQNSSLVELAREIEAINWDTVLPLAASEEAKERGPGRGAYVFDE